MSEHVLFIPAPTAGVVMSSFPLKLASIPYRQAVFIFACPVLLFPLPFLFL